MPILLLAPIGVFPTEWQTTANRPSNQSHVSVDVILPPGPMGLGFISPATVHFPTKYASR